jgi:hypothetical protein
VVPREPNPEILLREALQRGNLVGILNGEEKSASYWYGKWKVDDDTRFKAEEVRRIRWWDGKQKLAQRDEADAETIDPVVRADALLASLPVLREQPKLIKLPEREPRGKNQSAAWTALNALYPDGVPENIHTSPKLVNQVNNFIKTQARAIVAVDRVTREDIDRVLKRKNS